MTNTHKQTDGEYGLIYKCSVESPPQAHHFIKGGPYPDVGQMGGPWSFQYPQTNALI